MNYNENENFFLVKNKFLQLFTLALLLGCEYQFSDDYFKDIELVETSVSFSITNFNDGDVLRAPKNIEYFYSASDRNRLYEIQFFVNDVFIERSSEADGTFFLDLSDLNNGDHTLRVEYYFKTSSGSLAETVGQESFVVVEEFSFQVDKTAIELEIEQVEHRDGSIYIHFKDYSLLDEIDVSITPSILIYNDQGVLLSDIILSKEIIEQGIFHDNASLDFNLRYKTKIQNYYGATESEFTDISIPDTFEITASATENGNFKFNYTQHPLYNNIGSLKLIYDKFEFSADVILNVNATEYILNSSFVNFVFGKLYEYRLEINNKIYYEFGYQYSKFEEGEFFRGEKFDVNNYKKFLYDNQTDKLFALSINNSGSVYIDELSSNTLTLVRRNFVTNTNNTIGDFTFTSNNNFIIDLNRKSIEVDLNSFSIVKEHNISEFNSSALKFNTIVRFRGNIFAIDNVDNHQFVSVYDIPSGTLILQKQKRKNFTFNISEDGTYFNLENKIYRKNNNTLSVFYTLPSEGEFYSDYVLNSNKVYTSLGSINEIDLLTSSTNKLSSLVNIDKANYINSQNKVLALHSEYFLYFYDLNTNQYQRKTIEIKGDAYFYLAQKNYLISPYGFVLKNYQ
ncbi:hypothetical protein PG911_13970 [Tenacibaculum ovolyticum]|uniref:hypothetical protein n=1 Tax=Tenacibaculum ovolyticum TaxID=104270 RepID=UPI0022F3E490|nr:hypothetical protein [Tenacibaculum ovolyticum]WBX75752.1 hypothetical protein PG911_13970 [Tenacibaculum ovolyticum]